MEAKESILNSAMELERKNIAIYDNLSRGTIIKEVSNIFRCLAYEEKSHYEILKSWREKTASPFPEEYLIISELDAIFTKFSEYLYNYGKPATHYYYVYEKARTFEEKSLAFYETLLGNSGEDKKDIVLKIIEQEKKHTRLLANMLKFLRHPGEWLENAEWYAERSIS